MAVTDKYWESPYFPHGGQLVYSSPGQEEYYGSTKHAGQNYNFTPDLSYMFSQGNSGGIGGMFDKLKSKFKGGSGTGGGFFAPGIGSKFSSATSTLANPQFDWTKSSGIQGWGKNLGKGFNIANTLYQGYNAAQGLKDLSEAKDISEDTISDIITASYNDPMIQYNLNSEQLDMLRQLRRGSFDSDASFSDVDLLGALGGAAKGAVTGIAGGIPGMIIGAIGGGGNAIIDDLNQAQGVTNSDLEALYQAVLESERQYNDIRKQRAYANLAGY